MNIEIHLLKLIENEGNKFSKAQDTDSIRAPYIKFSVNL